jgi:hypothetical protein
MTDELDKNVLNDLVKDVVETTRRKRDKIDDIIQDVRALIRDIDDAYRFVPIVKDLLDVSVKNDDQITKAATIVQRILTTEKNAGGGVDSLLSDADKEALLQSVRSSEIDDQVQQAQKLINDKGS